MAANMIPSLFLFRIFNTSHHEEKAIPQLWTAGRLAEKNGKWYAVSQKIRDYGRKNDGDENFSEKPVTKSLFDCFLFQYPKFL